MRRVPHLWLGYVAMGAIALVVYYLLPTAQEEQSVLYIAIGISAALAMVVGVAIHRPPSPVGWLLFAAAMMSSSIGDVFFFLDSEAISDTFFLAMYVFLIPGLLVFVRRRIPRGDAATLIDPTVLAVAAGVPWWVYLLAPLAAEGETTIIMIAYPALDLVVLAVALRLILGSGARTAAFRLMAIGLLLMLAVDWLHAVKEANGTFSDGTWIDAGWMLSYLALGASALHPSMRWLDSRAPAVSRPIGTARVTVLVIGALAPVLMLVVPGRAGVDHLPFVVATATLLLTLVAMRLVALAASERERALTDPLTGLHTMGLLRASLVLEGERALRTSGQLGVVVLELDHFRLMAQTYGQPAGDRVLREVASRLQGLCRPGDLVARTGNHRFGVMLQDADGFRTARFAEAVRDAVADPKISLESDVSVRVTASLGVAALPHDAPVPERLLQVAEQAQEAARAAGGNRIHGWRGPLHLAFPPVRR